MNLKEIKQAISEGKTVRWSNGAYKVTKDAKDQYFITCESNNSSIGLTWTDEVTLNGKEEDFLLNPPLKKRYSFGKISQDGGLQAIT